MNVCTHCGYENDLTRVFCHNCGNRLDQAGAQPATTAAAAAPIAGSAPAARPNQPPPRKQQVGKASEDNSPGVAGAVLRAIVSTAVLAAMLACVVQIVRPPLNLPPPQKPDDNTAQALYENLKLSSGNPSLPIWVTNVIGINNYLASALHAVTGSGGVVSVEFQRAFVILGQGTFRLWLVETYSGYPIYFALDLQPVTENGGMELKIVGGQIGHLPVHPMIAPMMGRLFGPMADGLYDPLQMLKAARSADINPNTVKITWPGTSNAPR